MPSEVLQTVLRIRRAALDEVRRELAEKSQAAARAHDAVRVTESVIARETQAASDTAFDDASVEAFGAWIPAARQRLAEALSTQERREAEVAHCRAELSACRTAVESIEALLAERQAAAAAGRARKEQATIQERACRRFPGGLDHV